MNALILGALEWNITTRGIIFPATMFIILCGATYVILATNVGNRLGFLLANAGFWAWMVLMTITLALFYMALYARLMRATMLDQRGLDYVTTARAKGLTERRIAGRHMLRNALLPVLTMAGVQVGGLLGGSVVVESVFAWPGLGQLAFEALFSRDFNLLLGIFFMSACLVVAVNIIVDVLYVMLDPRVRIG